MANKNGEGEAASIVALLAEEWGVSHQEVVRRLENHLGPGSEIGDVLLLFRQAASDEERVTAATRIAGRARVKGPASRKRLASAIIVAVADIVRPLTPQEYAAGRDSVHEELRMLVHKLARTDRFGPGHRRKRDGLEVSGETTPRSSAAVRRRPKSDARVEPRAAWLRPRRDGDGGEERIAKILPLLSPADGQLVELLAEGLTYKEAGDRLDAKEAAIKKRVERIRAKASRLSMPRLTKRLNRNRAADERPSSKRR